MTFNYTVRDLKGKTHEGELDAPSIEAASQELRQNGFTIVELTAEDEESAEDGEGLFPRRVSKQEIIYITSQLAVMTDTGITLSTALQSIREQEDNPALRRVLADLQQSVESGEDFSSALSKHPKLFDKTYVSLMRASEATGTMGEMLERIATYLRKESETVSKVKAALAYPAVMLAVAISVTIFLLTYVLPKFAPLFNRPGAKLPAITKVMMTASDSLLHWWWAWLAGIVALIVAFLIFRRTNAGRQSIDTVKIKLPLMGTLFRKIAISRSIRTLGTMIASGVPMLEAIKLSAAVAGNFHFERLWNDVGSQVTEGNRIADSLMRSPLFPRMLIQMIRSGEETGKLDKVMLKISNFYDQEVDTTVKATTSMVEPIMITVMGVVVGGIGMGLLLPIFSLSKPG
jgi:type IV pilus assembly protein PilC